MDILLHDVHHEWSCNSSNAGIFSQHDRTLGVFGVVVHSFPVTEKKCDSRKQICHYWLRWHSQPKKKAMKKVCLICCGAVVEYGSEKQFWNSRICAVLNNHGLLNRWGLVNLLAANSPLRRVRRLHSLQWRGIDGVGILSSTEFHEKIIVEVEEIVSFHEVIIIAFSRFWSDLFFLESTMQAFVSVTESLISKN